MSGLFLYRNCGCGKRGKTKSATNGALIAVVENVKAGNGAMLAELNVAPPLEDIVGQYVGAYLCFGC